MLENIKFSPLGQIFILSNHNTYSIRSTSYELQFRISRLIVPCSIQNYPIFSVPDLSVFLVMRILVHANESQILLDYRERIPVHPLFNPRTPSWMPVHPLG